MEVQDELKPEKGVVIQNIIIRPVQRSTQDIQKWRSALQSAEGIMQYRTQLYDLYADLILDSVLSSLIDKRILNVIKNNLVFFKANGEPNEDATKLLQLAQFRDLRKQIMLQKFWGITVCELIYENKAFRIFNIDRKHIQPKDGKITYEQFGNEGIYYREPPYNKFVLEVGRWDDLGLLVKAAPYVIYKRGGFGNWANFAQIFGMPFREARYDGFNQATRLQLEAALESMGSAAYGIFPKESELTFHEPANVAANGQLYDALRNACNQELSILILGQTGTTMPTPGKLGNDDTQADTEDDINASDRADELSILNEQVLPIMVNLGLLPADGYFAYEVIKEKLSLTDMATVINTLKNMVKLPLADDDIYELTGMPKPANYDELKAQQEEERQNAMNAQQGNQTPPNQKTGQGGQKKLSGENVGLWNKFKKHVDDFFRLSPVSAGLHYQWLSGQLNELYTPCCANSEHEVYKLASPTNEDAFAKALAQMVKDVWQAQGMPYTLNEAVTRGFIDELFAGVVEGFGNDFNSIDYDTQDYNMLASLQKRCVPVQRSKNYQQLKALTGALIGEDGRVVSFNEFKKAAFEINDQHVNQWLKTEYDTAIGGAQMAGKWVDIEKSGSMLLQFDAVMDTHTTQLCGSLNGLIKPVADPFWDIYYPPNHFNCRSTVRQLNEGSETPNSEINYPEKMPAMFAVNLAKRGLAFPPNHPYYDGVPDSVLRKADNMLNKDRE